MDQHNADIYILSGDMASPVDDTVLELVQAPTKPHAILVLCTPGGQADVAYRISRAFQNRYERFTVLVGGYCKSAGTLLLLGADDVVLGAQAELGPLDVQILKDDELFQRSSGLAPAVALQALGQHLAQTFKTQFFTVKFGLSLSTKTAAETAATLTVGALAPIYAQLDPLRIAEMQMAMQVALFYGSRLDRKPRNLRPGALDQLVGAYPEHGFVIDLAEAKDLFVNVRAPSEIEAALLLQLNPDSRTPRQGVQRIERLAGAPQTEIPFKSQPEEPEHEAPTPASAPPVDREGAGADSRADGALNERPAASDSSRVA